MTEEHPDDRSTEANPPLRDLRLCRTAFCLDQKFRLLTNGNPLNPILARVPTSSFFTLTTRRNGRSGPTAIARSRRPIWIALAARGAIFRNAFTVTPVCSPSRAALMTGRYPSELGIADWIDPRKEPDLGLAPAAVTWPELFKGFGYATMLAGKWHLGTRDEFHPTRQGFDRFFGFRDGSNQPIDPRLEVDGQVRQLKGSLPDLLVDEGLRFIEHHRQTPSCCRSISARRTRLMGRCPKQIRPLPHARPDDS